MNNNERPEDRPENQAGKQPEKWYFKTSSLIVLFFFIGPLILPIIFLHPRYSKTLKFILSLALIIFTFFTFMLFYYSFKSINNYYHTLWELHETINAKY